jgi:hypothetical protein
MPALHALGIDSIVLLRLEDLAGYLAATERVIQEKEDN